MEKTNDSRPTKLLKIKIIAVISVLLVTIVAFFLFFQAMSHQPEEIVKKYMSSYFNRKFGDMYDMLSLPNGEFMTKEIFVKAIDSQIPTAGMSAVTTVKEAHDTPAGTLKFLAGLGVYSGGVEATKAITLVPIGRDFGLFNNYKIVPDNSILADELRITVPKDSKIWLYGKEITTKNSRFETKENFDTGIISDSYLIDTIFLGTYTLKVSTNFSEDFEKTFPVDYKASTTIKLSQLKAKKADVEKLVSSNKQIFDLASTGKSADELKKFFVNSNNYTAIYDKIKSSVSASSFSDFKSDFGERKLNDKGELTAQISFKCNNKSVLLTATYHYDNQNWLISNIE